MTSSVISDPHEFDSLCARLRKASSIAFDTEFVSEDTYRPQLCLVQVAFDGQQVAIDPLALPDLTPFWEALAAPGHETIVHAGREEMIFCLNAVGRPPAGMIDVQLGAALIGLDYPAGYGTLIHKLLGEKPSKGETRTDWRRRPLSDRQIDYALDDVRHLRPLRDKIVGRLEQLNRLAWLEAETASFQREILAYRSEASERWRRVSGSSGLSARSLAIVRAVWQWREGEAERRNCPVRRVLRDDLIVELAKRRTADPKQIRAVRGLEHGGLQRVMPQLTKAVADALDLSDNDCPAVIRRESSSQLALLGQFLSTALGCICREAEVATSLVGTANDVRDLIAFRLGQSPPGDGAPHLAQGWRAEVVGQVLDDLLAGTVAIRIRDPRQEQPLAFERA